LDTFAQSVYGPDRREQGGGGDKMRIYKKKPGLSQLTNCFYSFYKRINFNERTAQLNSGTISE